MKNKLLFAIALLFVGSIQLAHATIRTVSNYYNSPGMYNDIQPAINAANSGDTIYVHASNVPYSGTYVINKPLTIFGAGFDGASYQFTSLLANVNTIQLAKNGTLTTASGTKISGLQIASLTVTTDTITNIILERNFFTGATTYTSNYYYYGGQGVLAANSNWIIRDNMFSGELFAGSRNNLIVNNFINTLVSEGPNTVNNNIIMGNYTSTPLVTMYNTIFDNNIIYNYNATAQALINTNQTGNTFGNNITYNFSGSFPGSANTGSNNVLNTLPKYNNGFATWLGFDSIPNYNWALQSSSPGHLSGTDGSDIGIYGGSFPIANLYGITQLPQVTLMNIINSTVPLNGNLNVNVIGIKRN